MWLVVTDPVSAFATATGLPAAAGGRLSSVLAPPFASFCYLKYPFATADSLPSSQAILPSRRERRNVAVQAAAYSCFLHARHVHSTFEKWIRSAAMPRQTTSCSFAGHAASTPCRPLIGGEPSLSLFRKDRRHSDSTPNGPSPVLAGLAPDRTGPPDHPGRSEARPGQSGGSVTNARRRAV
jgi:hypothetical protein